MALNQWSFLYVDKDFVPQGEILNAKDRSISLALSKVDTASLTIRTDHPMADRLVSLEGFLKVYRNNVLVFYGPLISAEESVGPQEGRITINAAGPAWGFQFRFAAYGASPVTFPSGNTRGMTMMLILSLANKQYYNAGEWGGLGYSIDITTPDQFRQTGHTLVYAESSPYSYAVGGVLAASWPLPVYKTLSEILSDFSSGTDGFDWRFMPYDNFVNGAWNGNPGIANVYFGAPIGSFKPEAVFEFGEGKLNIKSYTRTMTRDTQANSVRHLLNNNPEASPPSAADNPSKAKWGIMEDLAQADLTTVALRQTLVNEHVAVRKSPRHTIVFEPVADYGNGRLPRFGVDYDVGDTVTGRAVALGRERFNAHFRVWGVEFNLDDHGIETPKLTLDTQGAV